MWVSVGLREDVNVMLSVQDRASSQLQGGKRPGASWTWLEGPQPTTIWDLQTGHPADRMVQVANLRPSLPNPPSGRLPQNSTATKPNWFKPQRSPKTSKDHFQAMSYTQTLSLHCCLHWGGFTKPIFGTSQCKGNSMQFICGSPSHHFPK